MPVDAPNLEGNTAATTPVPVDTQSAPMTGGLQPPAQTPQPAPALANPSADVTAPPGSFFKNLSHSFTGAVLGAMAGREKIASYSTDDTGKQTPNEVKMTTGDQLRQIARSALLGLAAGANAPKQKSGIASALGGLGAGAEEAVDRGKQEDLLKRKQSSEDFEREQQAMLSKAQNAHTAIETIRAVQEVRNADLETQSKFAALGQDALGAAIAGGNAVPVQDMHMDDIMKYRQEHPEYLNYTPVLTKVTPKEGVDPNDPNAVDRFYSLIDYTKPVQVTQPMIDHLQAVGFPGAESLKAGQQIEPQQFKGLWYQGLKMYNDALRDPKNKDVIDITLPDGTPSKAVYNKTLGTTEILRDPESGKPLGGKIETEQARIMGTDGKTYLMLTNKANGKVVKNLGEAGSAADNANYQTYGDYNKTGDAYLATVEQPIRNNVKTLGDYDADPSMLGRGGANRGSVMSAVAQYRPGWNEANYKERYDYIKGYQNSVSGDGATRSRINTALGHLDLLGQARDGIGKSDFRALNQLANEYGIQTDKPGPVLYNLVAEKAATEAAAATGTITKEEIDSQRRNLQLNAGPAQQHQQIAGNVRLLKTQIDTLENNFKQAMGASSDELGRPVVYAQNKPIIDKWTAAKSTPTYAVTATGPNGHKVGSNDGGKTWVDIQSGQPIGAK